MDDIKVFAKKMKRTGDLDTNNKNILPGYGNGIWLKKCAMFIVKSGKRESVEEIKPPYLKSLKRRKITTSWEYCKQTPWNKQRRWEEIRKSSSEDWKGF